MIEHCCVSDLHLGALNSLFGAPSRHRSPEAPSRVSQCWAHALLHFVEPQQAAERPRLVLLGDTMDLQFSPRAAAACEAVRVLGDLASTNVLHDEILATAGNHDHALWTDARTAIQSRLSFSFDDDLFADRPATKAFEPDPMARSRVLDEVGRRSGFTSVDLRYPNIGLCRGDNAVVLHHGHFHESAYRVVSRLRDHLVDVPRAPETVRSLAAENGGWIDFAWSALGDAGGTGQEAEDFYQRMLTPTGFRREIARWAARAAQAAADKVPGASTPAARATIDRVARATLGLTLGRLREDERHHEVDALTPSALHGLRRYLEGPTARQIEEEGCTGASGLTYISGHTHKAYVDRIAVNGRKRPVAIVNTGGWTLNGPRLDNAEGAAMALIDGHGNTMVLRMFSTPRNGEMPPPRIEGFTYGNARAREFKRYLESRLETSRRQWDALSRAAHTSYRAIQHRLLRQTDRAA